MQFVGSDIAGAVGLMLAATGGWLVAFGLAIGGLLLAGIILCIGGIVGRLPTDQPRCRRCGQDLRSFADVPTACSGCGAGLAGGRAVTFGPRRRSARKVVAGAAMLALGLVGSLLMRPEEPAPLVLPPPPPPALSGWAALTFSKPVDPLAQPEIVAVRTLPVREGGAVEIVLGQLAPATLPHGALVSVVIDGRRIDGHVRTANLADAAAQRVLVLVVDFTALALSGSAADASGASTDATAMLRAASSLEIHVAAEDGTSATWRYRDPFTTQAREPRAPEAVP